MLLDRVFDLSSEETPLRLDDVPKPSPGPGEIRIRVSTCAVCHTELDEIEGRTPPPSYPMIPGHQVVGVVDEPGPGVDSLAPGERVGVGWIFSACGDCEQCRHGNENLCDAFLATGRDRAGGYAEYLCVPAAFAIPVPDDLDDTAAAPLFCAGAIGYRSLNLTGLENGQRLGLTGFGASAHLVMHLVRERFPDAEVHVFARSEAEQAFARELGAVWAGDTGDRPPHRLHAIIDTTPAWRPIVAALEHLLPGGRLVINAIRKEAGDQAALQSLEYERHLWQEKEIKSVANVTRRDITEFLKIAAQADIAPTVETFDLQDANAAVMQVKRGEIRGAKVLVM